MGGLGKEHEYYLSLSLYVCKRGWNSMSSIGLWRLREQVTKHLMPHTQALVMARSWLEFRREAWLEGDFWLLGLEQAVSKDE